MSATTARTPRDGTTVLGALVCSLRERAGLSQRQLARRMGVGVATISRIESGRPPRLSTLRSLAEHLPGATPRRLLEPEWPGPDPASEGLHRWAAERFGFEAQAVSLDVRSETWTLEIEGVVADDSRPELWLARARAVCVGSRPFILGLELDGVGGAQRDGHLLHEFELDLKGRRLNYRCQGTGEKAPEWLVEYPTQRLSLEVARPEADEGPLRLVAHPQGQPRDPARECASLLHPGGVTPVGIGEGDRQVAQLSHPVIGTRFSLSAEGSGSRLGEAASAATAVRAVRERAGLSERELARRAGVPHPTIGEIEAGSDPRVDTARKILAVLPELAPQDLLPVAGDTLPEDCWDALARFHGLVAEERIKVMEIGADGSRRYRVHTRGLRSLRPGLTDLEVRVGLRRAILQEAPQVLAEIEAADSHVCARRIPLRNGDDLHSIRFRRTAEGQAFNYARTYTSEARYTLAGAAVSERTGEAGPHRAGCAFPTVIPTERARLTVVFPDGYEPPNLLGHEWPSVYVPEESLMRCHRLPGRRLRSARRGTRLAIHLAVTRPTPGTSPAISWELPERWPPHQG